MTPSNYAWWSRYGELVFDLPHVGLIVPVRAQGSEFEDADGRRYLDLASGQMSSLLGHNHSKLLERVSEQIRRQVHTGSDMLCPAVFEAAAKLAQVAPKGLRRALLLSTGSEANEAAIRIAKAHTGRDGIIGLAQGYYGITQSLLSLGLMAGRDESAPGHYRVDGLDKLRELLDARGGEIAAMIIEPVRSVQGVFVPPPEFFIELSSLLKKKDILLIADECQTGFGRTGAWFGLDHYGVTPDLLVFAKGAGGGFPVGGVLATEAVAAGAVKGGYFHLSSHQQDPVAAAAVSAVIDIIREEGLVERAARVGKYFRERLLAVRDEHPRYIADVRGIGLLLGLEFKHPSGVESERDAMAAQVYTRLLAEGIRFGYGSWNGVCRLAPPLTITEDEIDRAVDGLERVLRAVC